MTWWYKPLYWFRHAIDLVLALKAISLPMAVLAMLTLIGTSGYMLLLDLNLLDALYLAIITLSTVGFSEIVPFTPAAKLFSIGLICSGVGTVFYVITLLAAMVVEGEVRRNFGRRLMQRTIDGMQSHYIVCGFGRVGEEVASLLQARKHNFVIIDREAQSALRATEMGFNVVEGDAEHEAVLQQAGIQAASALVAATTSDAANTYITLTSKKLNPKICVVARAGTANAAEKLQLAGANHVVSPYAIGARRMALSALQPMMADFMDALAAGEHGGQLVAELQVNEGSSLDGKALSEAFIKTPPASRSWPSDARTPAWCSPLAVTTRFM